MMGLHRYFPPVTPVRTRRVRWKRVVLVLALSIAVTMIVLGISITIRALRNLDAAEDAAFLQGMATGAQLCSHGSR